jgi:hypothetical protein
MNGEQYKISEEGAWTVIEITGYPFKDFHHYSDHINWLVARFGEPTYTERFMRVYAENEAYASILDKPDDPLGDPIYRFAFKDLAEAMEFYLYFV